MPHRSHDVVIVGGGVIGLACAWRAAKAGLDVVVLERETVGAGASGVAAGMLAPVGELEFGERALLELNLRAAEMYPEFVAAVEADSGLETEYRRRGALHVALDRDEADELRRRHRLQEETGLAAGWLTPRRCRQLEPGLSPRLAGGVVAPNEASIDPQRLLAALAAAAEARGAQIVEDAEVCELSVRGGRVRGVRTTGGHGGDAEQVVIANGAWSGAAQWLPAEVRPPVRPVQGQVVELRGPRATPVCERILRSERIYIVPREDGRLIVGATVEERGFDDTVTAGGVFELLREAYRLLPEVVELELVAARASLRPGTPDNLPRVGPTRIEGLLLATGHYRNGVLLAPLAAEQIAAALGGSQRQPHTAREVAR